MSSSTSHQAGFSAPTSATVGLAGTGPSSVESMLGAAAILNATANTPSALVARAASPGLAVLLVGVAGMLDYEAEMQKRLAEALSDGRRSSLSRACSKLSEAIEKFMVACYE